MKARGVKIKRSFTIRDLPDSERPRERLLRLGVEALSSPEILVLLLGRGTRGESVMVTAQKLISRFGSLKGIDSASLEELCKVNGIGLAKATQLKAAFELSRRLEGSSEPGKRVTIHNPEDIVREVEGRLKGKKKEHFLTLPLNTRNQLLDVVVVSIGSLDTSIVHPREAFKEAISASAAAVIFVHNHPSGDPQPSAEDIKLTKRLVEAGEVLGIDVLDHIIIGDNEHLSLKAQNLL